jgi:hypothetical protein
MRGLCLDLRPLTLWPRGEPAPGQRRHSWLLVEPQATPTRPDPQGTGTVFSDTSGKIQRPPGRPPPSTRLVGPHPRWALLSNAAYQTAAVANRPPSRADTARRMANPPRTHATALSSGSHPIRGEAVLVDGSLHGLPDQCQPDSLPLQHKKSQKRTQPLDCRGD